MFSAVGLQLSPKTLIIGEERKGRIDFRWQISDYRWRKVDGR
jgi:hypothetical protein